MEAVMPERTPFISISVASGTPWRSTTRTVCGRPAGADGEAFDAAKAPFNEAVVSANEAAGDAAAHLDNALAFLDAAFGEGQEEVLFVSKLSVDPVLMRFVAGHAGPSFAEHAKQLMFHERGLDLLDQVDKLRG